MIKAECVAASKCQTKIATFKVTMPRNILAEAKTHRIISKTDEGLEILSIPGVGFNDDPYLSKNSASNRAIPVQKLIKSLREHPYIPIAWQLNHKGMQGTEYLPQSVTRYAEIDWKSAMESAITYAGKFVVNDITKQIVNRLLEPFMYHTVLVTATEWDNFFELRCPQYMQMSSYGTYYRRSRKDFLKNVSLPSTTEEYKDWTDLDWLKINKGQADIHMMAVAEAIYDAWNEADFKELAPGEWHIPFGDQIDEKELVDVLYSLGNEAFLVNKSMIQQAKVEIAVARCARLSYQTLGDNPVINYKADLDMYYRLKKDKHWSPFEHVAYAMSPIEWDKCLKAIIGSNGHIQHEGGWMANFRGWIQQRALLENAA